MPGTQPCHFEADALSSRLAPRLLLARRHLARLYARARFRLCRTQPLYAAVREPAARPAL